MKLVFTKSFVHDYRRLPQRIQEAADKQLELLSADQNHPSLNIKKMNDPMEIWEGRVTRGYRFTFQIEGELYLLRRLGTHDILRAP